MTRISELMIAAGQRDESAPAVVSAAGSVSYGELRILSSRLAAWLSESGARPGDRIGLWLEKSVLAVTGIYAVLQLGASYVPLDCGSAPAFVSRALEHCGVRFLLSDRQRAARLGRGLPATVKLLVVDDFEREKDKELRSPAAGSAADIAAILYTSGSTGQPKGAAITHGNLVAFTDWAARAFELAAGDRLLSHAPLHFDLSFFDVFAAHSCGAAVVLATPEETGTAALLAALTNTCGVTVWQSVPFALTLQTLAKERIPMPLVRHVLFAGERMPRSTLLGLPRLFPNARFHNIYGGTETNDTFMYTVPLDTVAAPDPLPIGRPLPHVGHRIVDGEGADVPRGEVGTLLVSGSTVMAGYVAPSPGQLERIDMFYDTKDLVSEGCDGDYRFHGRTDAVVKTRGHRVNLTEVEQVLSSHTALEEVAVVAMPDPVIGSCIVAVVKAREAAQASKLGLELRKYCALMLPRHAIPQRFEISRDVLPKSSTGKIERKVLLARLTSMLQPRPTKGGVHHGDA